MAQHAREGLHQVVAAGTEALDPALPVANAFDRIAWQRTLFAETLSRFALLRLRIPNGDRRVHVHVHRNHSVEQIAGVLRVFLAFSQLEADVTVGDYDDTLSGPWPSCDLHLVWLDFDRYTEPDSESLTGWLCRRLTDVCAAAQGPVIVADAPDGSPRATAVNAALRRWSKTTPGATLLPMSEVAARLGKAAFDVSRAALTGTRYADAACLEAARVLGLTLIPGQFGRPIKAIAVDLDNTLYEGVLGEDGVHGLHLTPAHAALQAALADLAAQGVLLVVCSKNEREDVDRLFAVRDDFPLRAEHVAVWQVSWASKADAIARAAAALRIASDAMLMLDDNAGELAAASRAHPGMRVLFAGDTPDHTVGVLRRYPSLWPSHVTTTDALRRADLQAVRLRADAAKSASSEADYLRSLGISLAFRLDPHDDVQRLVDLSARTNQFNLTLGRCTAPDVSRYLNTDGHRAVAISLRDRLSDSGVVGLLLLRQDAEAIVVDELCISCRALGRELETAMIVGALLALPERFTVIRFRHRAGPRNRPALTWLAQFSNQGPVETDGTLEVRWDRHSASLMITATPIVVEGITHG